MKAGGVGFFAVAATASTATACPWIMAACALIVAAITTMAAFGPGIPHPKATGPAAPAAVPSVSLGPSNGGSLTVPLPTAGTRYFKCQFSNHCQMGQLVSVVTTCTAPAASPPPKKASSPPPKKASSPPPNKKKSR